MRLIEPTDFEVLEVLSDGKRNNAVNIAYELEKNRPYVNTRLPVLRDYGLVETVGPAPQSGLYVITERGRAASDLRDRYGETEVDFEVLLEEELASRETQRGSVE